MNHVDTAADILRRVAALSGADPSLQRQSLIKARPMADLPERLSLAGAAINRPQTSDWVADTPQPRNAPIQDPIGTVR